MIAPEGTKNFEIVCLSNLLIIRVPGECYFRIVSCSQINIPTLLLARIYMFEGYRIKNGYKYMFHLIESHYHQQKGKNG